MDARSAPCALGVVYESDEWSDHKLAAELERALAVVPQGSGWSVRLVDMEQPDCIEQALGCDLLVSRVFASAQFRGHGVSLEHMGRLIPAAEVAGIPLINPGRAHRFEVDKAAAGAALAAAGLQVPRMHACAAPASLAVEALPYPCIVKPNCGGRTTYTAILDDAAAARAFFTDVPDIGFVAQEYIRPERGFITRLEIVGGAVALAVKRSVAEGGLSAYRLGSTYAPYPDLPDELRGQAELAARTLGFTFGSFDIIECARGAFFIDANSVSNVSEDCTELLGMDLMRAHAQAIAQLIATR